jgi:hypothetical protein
MFLLLRIRKGVLDLQVWVLVLRLPVLLLGLGTKFGIVPSVLMTK